MNFYRLGMIGTSATCFASLFGYLINVDAWLFTYFHDFISSRIFFMSPFSPRAFIQFASCKAPFLNLEFISLQFTFSYLEFSFTIRDICAGGLNSNADFILCLMALIYRVIAPIFLRTNPGFPFI